MNIVCFNTFPLLATDLTILRQLVIGDGTDIFKLRSDDRVNKYLGRPLLTSYVEAQQFISKINKGIDDKEWLYWGIVSKAHPSLLIGTICLWNFSDSCKIAEIGYELKPDFQGKGIMQEVLKSVIDFGFRELKLKTITAYVHIQNIKSLELLKKSNFEPYPQLMNKNEKKEELKNTVIYAITNSKNQQEN